MDEEKVWSVLVSAVAVAAVAASKPVLERGWRLTLGSEPPNNPAHQDVTWRHALLWALVTGAMVGVVRLLAQRLMAEAWHRATGHYPKALASTRS
jgi:Protein of unknown function (DUF4235)